MAIYHFYHYRAEHIDLQRFALVVDVSGMKLFRLPHTTFAVSTLAAW